jgi:hypothetical protein
MERYKPEENDKANPQAEQDAWEADQMRRTHLKVGDTNEARTLPEYACAGLTRLLSRV